MAIKHQSSTTIRIDLLPDLHENPGKKRIISITSPSRKPLRISRAQGNAKEHAQLWGPDFQELFQSVYDGTLITDIAGQIIDVNERLLRFSGYTYEELRRSNALDLISCADAALLETILSTLHEEKYVLIEAYCRRKDESVFPSEITVNQVTLSTGTYLCFFIRDTSQRENEEELRRQMHFIINRSHAVAFRVAAEPALPIAYISDSVRQYGYDFDELMDGQHRLLELVHPDDETECSSMIMTHARLGAEEVELECRVLTSAGETRWIHLQGWFVRDEDGAALFCQGVFMDISERKHIEEERAVMEIRLRQAQKLESMGQLAAGIAHEINSPTQFVGDSIHFLQSSYSDLCSLMGHYDHLMERLVELDPGNSMIDSIRELHQRMDYAFLMDEIPRALDRSLKGIKRIADIVLAMKEFSHPGGSERLLVDINKTIENAITVAKNEWKYVAEMETRLDDAIPMIRCVPGEINQVILNLLVNAAQSIAEQHSRQPSEKGRITISTRRDRDHVLIDLQDTGVGIPEEIKNRVFDPFFTTKEVGKGTGQGLTIAYNIVVNRHGGKLSFESVPGQGAAFHISLPVDTPREEPPRKANPTPAFAAPANVAAGGLP